MTGAMFNAEVDLARQVAFIDRLTETGALTPNESHVILTRIGHEATAPVGALLLQVRLDKAQV